MSNKILIGCVADDFTGASDAASFLISQGMKTLLFNGIPNGTINDCNAVVIALKSRTQSTSEAVADSMAAFKWLEEQGTKHLYFKYCSTFDSTKDGNIGPVLDAILEHTGEKFSIISPALPVNGRVVRGGILYVDGVPLGESHMKNHPLTPMWASKLSELMQPQGKYETLDLNYETLNKNKDEILKIVDDFASSNKHFYIVPDYVDDANGDKVAELFGDSKVLSGGSGILAPLAKRYVKELGEIKTTILNSKTRGKALLLAGSCSKTTISQIVDFKNKNYPTYRMDPLKLLSGEDSIENIWDFILENKDNEVLIYSTDTPENVVEIQKVGKEKIAELLESTTANLAQRAVDAGYTRIIIAGGETSSAVAKKLGYDSFEIGESVAAGVPVMAPLSNPEIRVIFKSGNFGQVDMFERALSMTKG